MPTLQDVEAARNKASQSAQTASSAASRGYTVEDELKTKLNEAYNYNQDIVKPLDDATSSYLTAPNVAREKYQDIFNPFAREKLVAQYTGQEAKPMLSLANILGTRRGSIADTVNAGTNSYQAYATNLNNQAQLDRQGYQDVYGEYGDEFNRNLALQDLMLKQQAASNKGSGLGEIKDLLPILNYLKPSDAAAKAGDDANVGLGAIDDIRTIMEQDPGALKWAGGGITGLMGRIRSGGNDEILRKNITTLVDTISRYRSGAALTEDEQNFYRTFVADPFETISSTEGTNEALRIAEKILGGAKQRGTDQFQPVLQQLMQSMIGGGTDPNLDSIYGY